MQVFDRDWIAASGTKTFYGKPRDEIELFVSCTKNLTLYGLRQGEEVVLAHRPEIRLRQKFGAFEGFKLKPSTTSAYGLSVSIHTRQDGEPLDDENPPAPPLPGSDNLVAQFARLVRDNTRAAHGPYLEPEDLPLGGRYEVDEDDERFEEELAAEARASQAKRKAQAAEAAKAKAAEASNSQQNPEGGKGPQPGGEPPQKAPAAEPQQKGE